MSSPSFILSNGVKGVPDYSVEKIRPKSNSYALVIPVLNENGRLISQLTRIKSSKADVDIIIADGGSTDNSVNLLKLKNYGVSTLLSKIGPGKLSAQLRTAFHYAIAEGYSGVITMDGNDKDGEEGIQTILEALIAGFDFVQGSRFIKGGSSVNTPKIRYFSIRFIHAPLTSLAARHWFTDTTNGFRGISKAALEDPKLSVFRDIFYSYELLAYIPIQCSRLGYKIIEVPVKRSYPDKGKVPTKIHGLVALLGILKILVIASGGGYAPKVN